MQDCSAATENLLLAATALGIGAVWLGIYSRIERVRSLAKVLSLPKDILPLNLIAIGYPEEKKEPRAQYEELRVHRERW